MSVKDIEEASDDGSFQPCTVKDFQNVLTDYVNDTGLSKFFPRDDPFIQDLAGRAAKLRESSDPLGKPENLKNLITLSSITQSFTAMTVAPCPQMTGT